MGFISPAFDVNDLGFLFRADVINAHLGAGYDWTTPTNFYRELTLGAALFRSYDFGGEVIWQGFFHFGDLQFLNYYEVDWDFAINRESMNNTRTRGGPYTLNPDSFSGGMFIHTDSRKDWILSLYGNTWQNGFSKFHSVGFTIEYRPVPYISFSINPEYDWNLDFSQYIDTYDDHLATETYGKRYVYGELYHKTYSANIRLNWTLSPTLSLQLFIQPLISSGEYVKYKELKAARTYYWLNYGEEGSTFDDENYIADPDGDGPAPPIDVGNNDFNIVSLRGNAVLRWEYLRGSVIFFVWTQSRVDEEDNGDIKFGDSFNKLVTLQPDNIFMVKFTYWFNM